MRRPGTQEVWLTNRPVHANGYLLRFNGETHTVITTPTAKLETMSTTTRAVSRRSAPRAERNSAPAHRDSVTFGCGSRMVGTHWQVIRDKAWLNAWGQSSYYDTPDDTSGKGDVELLAQGSLEHLAVVVLG
jgi:hypothetical protein